MIYTAGCILLALTAFPPPEVYGPFIGLLLISIGTGGIKPCVVTFGGDQFERKQVKHKASFFSTFYFVINIGSLLSTVVTPLLRSDVQCVENSCYPLAFGVPAILMTLALGRLPDPTTDEKKDNSKKGKHKKKKEKHKDKEDNEKRKKHKKRKKDKKRKDKKHKDKKHKDKEEKEEKGEKKGKGKPRRGRRRHGPDKSSSAKTLFEPEFVKDVKMLTRLIWLFLPLPLFWALFNQQSFLGSMKPEQMQAMNPLLIILLIPVFERVIYPCMKSCSIPHKPLQRMVMGMLFCALAFVFAGLLQMKIEDNLERPVPDYMSGYTIFNTIDCKIQVRGEPLPFFQGTVPPFGQTSHKEVLAGKKMLTLYCPTTGLQTSAEANLESGKAFRLVVTALPGVLRLLVLEEKREKSTNGTAFVSYQLSFPASATQREPVTSNDWTEVGKPFEVGSGGIYTLALIDPSSSFDFADVVVEMYVDVKENSLSMILMIPQYIAMTIGEILFSISGLAFAYTQSPESMKSIIQALWLLTTSVGDLIVVLVAETRMVSDQANEFLLFAGLMVTATVVFAFMTCFYTYLDESALRRKKQGQHKGKGGKKGKRARPKRKPQGKGQKKRGGRSRGRRPSREKKDDDEVEKKDDDEVEKKDDDEVEKKDDDEVEKKDDDEVIKKDDDEVIKKDDDEREKDIGEKKDDDEVIKKDDDEVEKKDDDEREKKDDDEVIKKDDDEREKKDDDEVIKKDDDEVEKKDDDEREKKDDDEVIKKDDDEVIKKDDDEVEKKDDDEVIKKDDDEVEKKDDDEREKKDDDEVEKKDDDEVEKKDDDEGKRKTMTREKERR
ncbi:hypothetical protein ACOMHN_002058 [Nucella lapillus]